MRKLIITLLAALTYPVLYAQGSVIKNAYATGYYCVYDTESAGSQTVKREISGETYTLKASFLFGGYGVPMQGTGRTGPGGDYIKYMGGGGRFVRIDGPEFTNEIRGCYARLGITNFKGFGNMVLSKPDKAAFERVANVVGSSGRVLKPMRSIAVDPSVIPLGATGKLVFKSGTMPDGKTTEMYFSADDTGGGIDGRHIDIYLGEGNHALKRWYESGGNRYVTVRF